jgi:hypothetical protein
MGDHFILGFVVLWYDCRTRICDKIIKILVSTVIIIKFSAEIIEFCFRAR